MTIADDVGRVCEDYQWLCEVMRDEQLQFARTRQYRLGSFAEALHTVYENGPFMARYLNGLLVGRVLWLEQLRMLVQYADEFLPGNKPDYRHLEIGPGHGILLYLAAQDTRCAEVAALDVSASSLRATHECLRRLEARASARLIEHDIFAGVPETSGGWDSIVVSEVLEHLEAPDQALGNLAKAMTRDGRMFISTPVNCPMPDHIYLFKSPEEVRGLVESCGLTVVEQRSYLSLGHTEERARKYRYPIACTLIAQPRR
ncbi:MAG: class I SAM-dependent methyltransferase [Betaproteobacteria bacterium]